MPGIVVPLDGDTQLDMFTPDEEKGPKSQPRCWTFVLSIREGTGGIAPIDAPFAITYYPDSLDVHISAISLWLYNNVSSSIIDVSLTTIEHELEKLVEEYRQTNPEITPRTSWRRTPRN